MPHALETCVLAQVDLTQDLGVEATHRALDVKSHALAAKEAAEGAGQVSNRQQVAFSKAKLAAEDVRAASEKARHAFRCVGSELYVCCVMLCSVGCRGVLTFRVLFVLCSCSLQGEDLPCDLEA